VNQEVQTWKCGRCVVSLEKPVLVGILNTTPDSFSDGGEYVSHDLAVAHALKLIDAGASIIDVGGESTRPGASRVPAEVQIARTQSVIQAIRDKSEVSISIDTTLSAVAREAIKVGANIINDVASGQEDAEMFSLAAETGVGIVLMHRRLPPELDSFSDQYEIKPQSDNIVDEVKQWLLNRAEMAQGIGICMSAIALDPGFGFGKSIEQNCQLVQAGRDFVKTGYPIYVGLSRKSFIGSMSGIDDVKRRDAVSATAALKMSREGVQIFRVHNVAEHVRVLQSTPQPNTNI